jgi:uncharacterized membrane protein
VKHLWLYLKGIAMGSADVVPGVSGGTIAFITGIYTELLDSIKSINLQAFMVLLKKGPKAAWQAINGTFLLTLLAGILTAILSLAKVIHYLLDQHAILLWSFFFGLILASSLHMGKQIKQWQPGTIFALLLGTVCAGFVSLASPTSIEPSYLNIFFCRQYCDLRDDFTGYFRQLYSVVNGLICPSISGSERVAAGYYVDLRLRCGLRPHVVFTLIELVITSLSGLDVWFINRIHAGSAIKSMALERNH